MWLFASSTISVFVGLPLTTKVPVNPAVMLATPSPTRSVFSSNGSSYLTAKARGYAGSSPAMPSEAMPAYMIAAVAESAPTTRCLEEPSSAKAAIGIRIV